MYFNNDYKQLIYVCFYSEDMLVGFIFNSNIGDANNREKSIALYFIWRIGKACLLLVVAVIAFVFLFQTPCLGIVSLLKAGVFIHNSVVCRGARAGGECSIASTATHSWWKTAFYLPTLQRAEPWQGFHKDLPRCSQVR